MQSISQETAYLFLLGEATIHPAPPPAKHPLPQLARYTARVPTGPAVNLAGPYFLKLQPIQQNGPISAKGGLQGAPDSLQSKHHRVKAIKDN